MLNLAEMANLPYLSQAWVTKYKNSIASVPGHFRVKGGHPTLNLLFCVFIKKNGYKVKAGYRFNFTSVLKVVTPDD